METKKHIRKNILLHKERGNVSDVALEDKVIDY